MGNALRKCYAISRPIRILAGNGLHTTFIMAGYMNHPLMLVSGELALADDAALDTLGKRGSTLMNRTGDDANA